MGAKVQAYVFVDTTNPGPRRVVVELRKIAGVVRADALELSGVIDTESKVVRWV